MSKVNLVQIEKKRKDKTYCAKRKTSPTKSSTKRKDGPLMKVAKKQYLREKEVKARFWADVKKERACDMEAKVDMKKSHQIILPAAAPSTLIPQRTFVSLSRPSSPPPVLKTYESEFQPSVNWDGEPTLRIRNLVPVNRRLLLLYNDFVCTYR
jgi:hypothetical protein